MHGRGANDGHDAQDDHDDHDDLPSPYLAFKFNYGPRIMGQI